MNSKNLLVLFLSVAPFTSARSNDIQAFQGTYKLSNCQCVFEGFDASDDTTCKEFSQIRIHQDCSTDGNAQYCIEKTKGYVGDYSATSGTESNGRKVVVSVTNDFLRIEDSPSSTATTLKTWRIDQINKTREGTTYTETKLSEALGTRSSQVCTFNAEETP